MFTIERASLKCPLERYNAARTEVLKMAYFVVIRERSSGWDWSLPMRQQAEWEAHAAFMDVLESEGFIVAGGPLGAEDHAARVMHVVSAPDRDAIETRMAEDPWTP